MHYLSIGVHYLSVKVFVVFLVSSVFTTSYFHFAAGELALLQVLLYVDSKGEEVRGGREGGREESMGGREKSCTWIVSS